MARDHFERHAALDGRADWNFNILFSDQPQAAELAAAYDKHLDNPALYPPIPGKWLHMTVLRAGYIADFTAEEMPAVHEALAPKLAAMRLPELTLGPWWLWSGGGPVLHVTPEAYMANVYEVVVESLRKVVGKSRLPELKPFIPHVTLAYNRDYDHAEEARLRAQLSENPVEPAKFRAHTLSSIKQEQTPPFYVWEIIKELPIGQAE